MKRNFSPLLTKTIKLGLLSIALLSSSLFASDPDWILKINPDQKWLVSHSEITLDYKVTPEDGLVLRFEPAPPPKVNYISATVPWEFEVPNGKISIDIRAEEARGCYVALRLTGTDGIVYETVFGNNKTGFPLSTNGGVAEAAISDFKSTDDFKLEPGTRIIKASLVFAPDAANTIYVSSITAMPDAK